jgi:lipopolysaccharide export system ATP-binding protein
LNAGTTPSSLSARGLRKSYRDRLVVDDIDIEVRPGEIVGLLGPNGAGKTTSFHMIVGLIKPDAGNVFIGAEDVTEMPVYRRSRRGIGYLPQETSVFRNLTVRENLELVCEEMRRPSEGADALESALIHTLMQQFGITHLSDTKGYALSGGERRRVEIARAMPLQPNFILLDEPFSGIDPIAVSDIQNMIQDLRTQGFGVLITDHNVRETLSITDRTYLIHNGHIILNGTPAEMMTNPLARKFYLGDDFAW